MQVEVDKFGRFVIPKTVRNHLGIKPGSMLELQEQDQKILLRLVDQKLPLQYQDGVLVYTAEATEGVNETAQKGCD